MRFAPYIAFFLSGASSLIFQTIWSRHLHHVFGASGVAISTVVTCFMAGLGLGAWIGGRYADRIKHPLITYGVVELFVGLWAIALPYMVDPQGWLASVNSYLRTEMDTEGFGFMVARFFCVLPILLVPTTLMGASLPLLSRHFVRMRDDPSGVAARVGVLYAVNTFGAVAGVNLAAFILMPTVGLDATNWTAVSMNLGLFALIMILRRPLLAGMWKPGEKLSFLPEPKQDVGPRADRLPEREPEAPASADGEEEVPAHPYRGDDDETRPAGPGEVPPAKKEKRKRKRKKKAADEAALPPEPAPPSSAEPPIPSLARKAAFVAFAVSGAAALCYEVVWSRALAMTIGSSVYSFGIILETFLIGIAGGSAIAAAVLGTGRRMLTMVGISSVLLGMLGNALWGVQEGVWTWLLMSGVFAAPIAIIWAAVAARRRAMAAEVAPDDTVPCLMMLVVPAAAGLLNAFIFEGHLPVIVGAVAVTLCVFLGLLLVLRRWPVFQLAMVQLFIAGATFVNYLFQDEIPCAFAQLVASIPPQSLPDNVGLVQFFMFLTAAFCTLPATMGMGAMFPLTLRIWTSGGDQVGRDVGVVYAGNTLGSIVGAWLPGFVLMPWLGMEHTLVRAGMFINLILCLVMLVASAAEGGDAAKRAAADGGKPAPKKAAGGPPTWHSALVYVMAPAIPAMIAVLWIATGSPTSPVRWNLSQMTLGVFRVSLAEEACNPAVWGEPDLVYYNDGLSTTVSVERWGRHYALKNNGKVDASNGDDMPTQIMVAGYPLLMHERGPRGLDVAVIGFGSGTTIGTTLRFPVRSVDAIELERSIPEASQFFQDVNGLDYVLPEWPYVQMDRLRIWNDDGRNHLASTDKMYDVIISEPSNPWITGVSDLFTTDHFRITKRRLRPGGIYCQWVQLYEMSPENIKTIYRTFASQFRHVVVFAAEDLSSDTVLLGSDSPLPLDIRRLQRGFALPGIADELERAYVHSPYDVLARTLLATRQEVLQYTQIEYRRRGDEWIAFPDSANDPEVPCETDCRREPAPLNTDDNMLIEFGAPQDLIGYRRYEGYLADIYSPDWPYGRLMPVVRGFGEGDEAARAYAELAMSLIAHGRKAEAATFIARSQQAGRAHETLVAHQVLTLLMDDTAEPRLAFEAPTPGPQMAPEEARELSEGFAEVNAHLRQGDFGEALREMEEIRSPVRMHSGPGMRFLYGYLLYKNGNLYQSHYQDAIDQLEDLVRSDGDYVQRHPEAYYFLARAHDAELNFDKALRNMRLYVEARLAPTEDLEDVPEPPAGEAPTTDAEGESDKFRHAWRPEGDVEASEHGTE